MTSTASVEVSRLRVHRGKAEVFDGIDLTIPQGQITGLLGPDAARRP